MSELYIGLMSGTSVDAVDAALVDFATPAQPQLLATHGEPPTDDLRSDLLALSQEAAGISLQKLGELDQRVGAWLTDATCKLIDKAGVPSGQIRAIGNHGQTLYHAPNARYPFSLQIGDPNRIAHATGIPVVADLRGADMAAQGQGAPLAPAFHQQVFTADDELRCVVNIGGIANISILPARHSDTKVTGFDTGPGNSLMDAWTAKHMGQPQDTDAQWAASGTVNEQLLNQMLQDPFFQQAPPKSTGREYFNLAWVREHIANMTGLPGTADIQRTLLELTALSISNAIADTQSAPVERVLLCGGGSHNPLLRQRLQALLAPCPVETTNAYGVPVDWVEAVTFAWLAMRRMKRQPGNLPSVTGAQQPVVLGAVYAPPVSN